MQDKLLTIAYTTSRKEPQFEWVFSSLRRQLADETDYRIVVVDFWKDTRGGLMIEHGSLGFTAATKFPPDRIIHVTPKPTVWQGEHRLTKEDWFAQCNARNTALCLAAGSHIAFIDDLSVLLPGWMQCVHEAIAGNYVMCGSYQKVKNLVVEDGLVTSFDPFPSGQDHRINLAPKDKPSPCYGNWCYGCSNVMPVEALLSVGGYCEALCDGMGYEDTTCGRMLENAGYALKFDPRAITYESEELHSQLPVMRREDFGTPPNDKSHALVRMASQMKFHPNYFGEEGLRGLRKRVLAGEPFPVMKIPEHDWFTGKLLSEL